MRDFNDHDDFGGLHRNVFSDGSALELATITGDMTSGLTASLTIAIQA
jgi:hypothetical protein